MRNRRSRSRSSAWPGSPTPDARDNYRTLLGFRDRLLAAPSLEAAYLDLVRAGAPGLPPLFLDQLVHVILRHALRDCADPLRLRAAELLFREQKVTIRDGAIMLADDETVELRAAAPGSPARLLAPTEAPPRSVELDVLDEANAELYWARSDRFDTVLDIGFTRPGLDALCRVLEAWVAHLTSAQVAIQPVQQIRDERWAWHVGLDAEASALLNDLYEGRTVDDARRARLLDAVPPRLPRPGRHVGESARPPGLSRPRDDRSPAGQAQAAEPPRQPAARARHVTRYGGVVTTTLSMCALQTPLWPAMRAPCCAAQR